MTNNELEQLPGSPGCFICDNNHSNPRALNLKLYWDEAGQAVRIPCTPDDTWCSFDDVVHGGLAASVLDEAMGWAVRIALGEWAFTADYHIRYKKALQPGKDYLVIASVVENKGRKITAQAKLLDADEQIVAQATAAFLPGKGKARLREAKP